MRVFGASLKERIKRIDPILFAASSTLSLISILTILGAVDNFGKSKLVMQVAMAIAGMVMVFLLANVDYKYFIDRFYIIMFLGSVLLLAFTLLFGISGINMETANKSWITIPIVGVSVQPSEFVKVAFLCTFSKHIDMVKEKINKPIILLGLMLHAGVIVGLILLSGDLGVALVYIGIILIMLFSAGLSLWYFAGVFSAAGLAFPFLWKLLKPYQRNRIIFGFQPHLDPGGVGMQPLMSRETIARGGFFGKGMFEGGLYEDLTASHTDFIFATVCEKFGYVGGFLVVAALAVLSIRLFWLAYKSRETMGKLICCGCAGMIIIQSLENLWMCLALVPVVGITLPLVSAGGSSLLSTFMILGVAHSVSAQEKKYYFSSSSIVNME